MVFYRCKVDKLTNYRKGATRQNMGSDQLFDSLISDEKKKDK
jgi:hypothetical protein